MLQPAYVVRSDELKTNKTSLRSLVRKDTKANAYGSLWNIGSVLHPCGTIFFTCAGELRFLRCMQSVAACASVQTALIKYMEKPPLLEQADRCRNTPF